MNRGTCWEGENEIWACRAALGRWRLWEIGTGKRCSGNRAVLERSLVQGVGKLVNVGGLKPIHDKNCFPELIWQGYSFSKKDCLHGKCEEGTCRGVCTCLSADEWAAIRPRACKYFPSDRKTLSSHSPFYFIPFHLIFHLMGAVKETL